MTLTSLLPTLRASIPAPLDPSAWPAGTHPTVDDVAVCAVSLCRYAEICGTPCVHTGAAVRPYSGGRASDTASVTVVLATVTDAEAQALHTDARWDGLEVRWSEARLLGRVSRAHDAVFAFDDRGTAALPADIRPGDLLAVPCEGLHTVGDVRR